MAFMTGPFLLSVSVFVVSFFFIPLLFLFIRSVWQIKLVAIAFGRT